MILVQSVSKRFGSFLALSEVTLEIREGETLVVFGPNGAGKTTLLRIVAGLIRPTEGAVSVSGKTPMEARAGIGYLGNESLLYPSLTLEENLHFFCGLYGVEPANAIRWIDRVGLLSKSKALVSTLSRGESQRAALARCLIHDPDYLIVDEPFAGLDDASAGIFGDLIAREARTTIIATHDVDRGKQIADEIVRLEEGRTK